MANKDFYYAFTGFFLADGCVHITKKAQPMISIPQRADNRAILDMLRDEFGGSICPRKPPRPTENPQVVWQVVGLKGVEPILKALQSHNLLPAKKMKDVDLVLEYIAWRRGYSHHLGENGRAIVEQYRQQLMAQRSFQSSL